MTNDELPDNLARALKALDDDAARTAARRIDEGRVAGAVIERLHRESADDAESAPAPRRRYGASLRVAAAAAVLAIGGAIAQRLAFSPANGPGVVGLPVFLATDSLDAGQATELLAAVEQVRAMPVGGADSSVSTTRPVSVDDLSVTELRTLLRIMESPEETQ